MAASRLQCCHQCLWRWRSMDFSLGLADCDANGPPGGQQVTVVWKGRSWGEWRVAFLIKGEISATSNWGWGVMFCLRYFWWWWWWWWWWWCGFVHGEEGNLFFGFFNGCITCFFRYSRSAAISACGSNFQWEQALQLFVQMADSPDVVSVNASISAFEKVGYILGGGFKYFLFSPL